MKNYWLYFKFIVRWLSRFLVAAIGIFVLQRLILHLANPYIIDFFTVTDSVGGQSLNHYKYNIAISLLRWIPALFYVPFVAYIAWIDLFGDQRYRPARYVRELYYGFKNRKAQSI